MLLHSWSHLSVPLLLAAVAGRSSAFVPHLPSAPSRTEIGTKTAPAHVVLASTSDENNDAADDAPALGSEAEANKTKKNKATLGFLTFDLDDTLYPVGPVFTEANQA